MNGVMKVNRESVLLTDESLKPLEMLETPEFPTEERCLSKWLEN